MSRRGYGARALLGACLVRVGSATVEDARQALTDIRRTPARRDAQPTRPAERASGTDKR